MNNKLSVNPQRGLSQTRTPSEQDLVLAEMLLVCATMQGRDLLPGETRIWGRMFGNERPEKLKWAFEEHLRLSKFFPKPADITEQLERYAARPIDTYHRETDKERKALEAHKQTPEYKEAQKELEAAWAKMAGKPMP